MVNNYTFAKALPSELYITRLKKHSDIFNTLTKFVLDHNIKGGFINGIGGLSKTVLGFFNINTKKYDLFEVGQAELVSCTGNIATLDNKSMLHLHALVSLPDGKTLGGHVMEGCIVNPTAEFTIITIDKTLERKKDDETGLNLLHF